MSLNDFMASKADSENLAKLSFPPLWVNDGHKDPEAFKKWFETNLPKFEQVAQTYIEDAWANLLWYTGEYIPTSPLVIRTPDNKEVTIPRQISPFVINVLGNLTDKRTSDLSVHKPNHEVVPTDSSERDRMTARALQPILEHIKAINEVPRLFDEAEKWNMVYGSIFMSIDFNPKAGDRKKQEEKGKTLMVPEGEVEIKAKEPWFVLPYPSRHWTKVPMVIEIEEIIHVEEARKKFQNSNIKPSMKRELFSFQSFMSEKIRPEEVVIYRVIYRPDEFLPDGAMIRCANSGNETIVLQMEYEKYPWSHNQIPLVRYTDIDVPGRLFPMSFYQNVKPIQHTYNNLAGLIRKYIYTMAHPKWAMVRGSCNVKSLGNIASIIQHRPGQPPVMQSVKPIGSDPFNFLSVVEDKMVQLSNSHSIGLGELPPNTRSGIMISRLREIEAQQRGPQIDKRIEFMKDVLLQSASVARDHYPLQSEERLERVVGSQMVPHVKELQDTNIVARYDVNIVTPSGFSQELTGRLEEIAFINTQVDPNLLTRQQKLDIIGAGLNSKHYDSATAALRAAEAENEMMSTGKQAPQPEAWEDHFQHWNAHMIDLQDLSFKSLPKKIQEMKKDHIRATEELMVDQAFNPDGTPRNQIYAEQLQTLNGFPRFYTPKTAKPQGPSPEEQALLLQQMQEASNPPAEVTPIAAPIAQVPMRKTITIQGPNGVSTGEIVEQPVG